MILPQQKTCYKKLSKYKVGALFMEPGTGKTLSAIELVRTIDYDLIVWFTPFQTKSNLKEEMNKWKFNAKIIGIESIQNSDRIYLDIYNKLSKAKNPVIVVDESLKIKNFNSKRTKRLIALGSLCEYKLILNGTPLTRNLLDLWSQMEFLDRRILQLSYTQFKNMFCEYSSVTVRRKYRQRTREWIVKYHNLDYLYSLIEPYIFESDLKLDLNKKYINIDYCLDSDEKERHEEIINKVMNDQWLMARPNFFLELTQWLQNNYSRSKSKFEIVSNIIQNNDINKILIFAKYIDTQNLLKKTFPDIKVLSYQKHSFGLNLQKYSRIIFFDKIWDYALIEQAERRIFRTGQQEDCVFYNLNANVGLDKMMDDNVARKADFLKEFKKLSLRQIKEIIK